MKPKSLGVLFVFVVLHRFPFTVVTHAPLWDLNFYVLHNIYHVSIIMNAVGSYIMWVPVNIMKLLRSVNMGFRFNTGQ